METPQVHLSAWFESGFQLYRENIAILIPASLLALVLSVASAGILMGPMLSGVLIITLRLQDRREPKPDIPSIFKGFGFLMNSVIFVVGWGIVIVAGALILLFVPGIGQLAAMFFIYSAQAFLMFGPFLIVDRNMDFRIASVASIQTVKSNFWPFLSVSAAAGVIGSMGVILFGIGIAITAPLQACILTVAYRAVFDPGRDENGSIRHQQR